MTNALLFALLLTQLGRIPWRRFFDAFDRWVSQRWPVTPKGRDDNGDLVEWRPRPVWAGPTTVEFRALMRQAFPVFTEEAT